MKNIHHLILCAAFSGASALAFVSCGGSQTEAMQSQIDSLTNTIEQKNLDLEFYQNCLFLVSDGLDSIAKADSNLFVVTSSREKTVTRESIKQDLDAYASLLTRQRERINQLEQQISGGSKDRERMQRLFSLLNKQIEEKNATIQKLQEKVKTQGFNLSMLREEVSQLHTQNTALQQENESQAEAIQVAQEMLNEAYYIVGTSRELKDAGVLSSRFLGKSKINADQIDTSIFTKVDIRNFLQLTIQSKKITIKSQHPSTSYEITTDKQNGITTLRILDEEEFWSQARFLVIQK